MLVAPLVDLERLLERSHLDDRECGAEVLAFDQRRSGIEMGDRGRPNASLVASARIVRNAGGEPASAPKRIGDEFPNP